MKYFCDCSQIWEIHRKAIAGILHPKHFNMYSQKPPTFLVLVSQYLSLHRNWNYQKMVIYGTPYEAEFYLITFYHVRCFDLISMTFELNTIITFRKVYFILVLKNRTFLIFFK